MCAKWIAKGLSFRYVNSGDFDQARRSTSSLNANTKSLDLLRSGSWVIFCLLLNDQSYDLCVKIGMVFKEALL